MSTLKNDIIVNPSDLYTAISNVSTTVPYTTQTPPLGVRAVTGDGREFRYVQAGAAALIVGQVQQGPVVPTTTVGTCPALAVGATTATLTITSSTVAAGFFAGGFLTTAGTVASGGGQCLKIANNNAITSSTSIIITLEDPVQFAITTSATFVLTPSLYLGVVVTPTTLTAAVAGVALAVSNNTSTTLNGLPASYYGWLQVKGFANVQGAGTVTAWLGVAPSGTTGGCVSVVAATTPQIGIAQATTTAGYMPINLLIS